MSNHSADYPAGILTNETLKSFFAITEAPDGTLTYTPGYERIPENWYRRPLDAANEYSATSSATNLAQMASVVPEALSVGGNTGTVNSFTGANLGNITGGAYQISGLTDPAKCFCFFYQLNLALAPDLLRSATSGNALGGALELLQEKIGSFVDPECAKIVRWSLFLRDDRHANLTPRSELRRCFRCALRWCYCWSALMRLKKAVDTICEKMQALVVFQLSVCRKAILSIILSRYLNNDASRNSKHSMTPRRALHCRTLYSLN